MFSGIVEEKARVQALQRGGGSCRLTVVSTQDHSSSKIGDSIAVEGVCLTVTTKGSGGLLTFDVSPETLRRSTLGELQPAAEVNLERSVAVGGRLHGHIVAGHVDTTVLLLERASQGNSWRLLWSLPPEIRPFIAAKGSVALAGVSLTIGEVNTDSFSVYIIPHTFAVTTLSCRREGERVNLEVDVVARYVAALWAAYNPPAAVAGGITPEFLAEHGYGSVKE